MLAVILAYRGDYRLGFAVLVIPAVITCVLIVVTKFLTPDPRIWSLILLPSTPKASIAPSGSISSGPRWWRRASRIIS